ncbi:MAG TPA: NlpC/P60 family protein [Desulfitobacteriaceae bacterium]|nr:NlpC/P60 family protein [Desulfitobacteriaceae bacterium]
MTLSGLLLASSIPWAIASSSATKSQVPVFNQVQISSAKFANETYTRTIREQLKWTTAGQPAVQAAVASQTITVNSPETTKAAETKTATKVETKTAAKVETKTAAKVETKTAAKVETKQKTKPAVKPVQTASAADKQISRGNTDVSGLIENALSLQGVPYVFGGTSRKGFDCSGFTQYVFAGSQISLPRTTFEQYSRGTSVGRDQLQQGDLVFFTTYKSGASHVGIYLSGGKFIHASNSGVRISSLNESYYNSHYVGARRVR